MNPQWLILQWFNFSNEMRKCKKKRHFLESVAYMEHEPNGLLFMSWKVSKMYLDNSELSFIYSIKMICDLFIELKWLKVNRLNLSVSLSVLMEIITALFVIYELFLLCYFIHFIDSFVKQSYSQIDSKFPLKSMYFFMDINVIQIFKSYFVVKILMFVSAPKI